MPLSETGQTGEDPLRIGTRILPCDERKAGSCLLGGFQSTCKMNRLTREKLVGLQEETSPGAEGRIARIVAEYFAPNFHKAKATHPGLRQWNPSREGPRSCCVLCWIGCASRITLPLTAKDIIEEDHPMNIGIFGTAGQRRANFAIQNADLLIALGAGLNSQKIGFNVQGFAPKAKKIVIDIDEAQLNYQILRPDLRLQADAGDFLREMLKQLEREPYSAPERWLAACARGSRNIRSLFPSILPTRNK